MCSVLITAATSKHFLGRSRQRSHSPLDQTYEGQQYARDWFRLDGTKSPASTCSSTLPSCKDKRRARWMPSNLVQAHNALIYDDTTLSALTTRQRAKRNFNTKTRIRNLRRTHSNKGYTIPQCALLDCSETWTAPNSLEASHLRDRAQRSLKHFQTFCCLLHMLHAMDTCRTIPKNLQEAKDPLHRPLTRRIHSVACTLLVCGVCLQSKTRTFAI